MKRAWGWLAVASVLGACGGGEWSEASGYGQEGSSISGRVSPGLLKKLCRGVDCSGHGVCVVESGVPQCSCEEGYLADGLSCVPAGPACGDATCDASEDCGSCEADCGACGPACGDGTCDGDEDCGSCEADCGACPPACGDATCDADEDCGSCEADCGACPGGALPLFGASEGGKTVVGPLVIDGRSNVVISGLRISNPSGHCIDIKNSQDVTVADNVIGPCAGNGVSIYNGGNITVHHNDFERMATGVYASTSTGLDVHHNYFLNMLGPFPRGQFVQFNTVTGGGNRINYNVGENVLGESYPEDAINLYRTRGDAADPIQVIGNKIRGGGPSASGGGIVAGDSDGGNAIVQGNILVDPGQYGVAIAGGVNIKLLHNKIYARQQSFTNIGLFVWAQAGASCSGHEVRGNEVNYTHRDGYKNPAWNAGNCGPVAGWSENDFRSSIDASIFDLPLH